MKIKVFKDKLGILRAKAAGGHRDVLSYLETEIQRYQLYALEILEAIDDIKSGKIEEWEEGGNYFYLILGDGKARVDDYHLDKTDEMPIDEFRELLEFWLYYLFEHYPDE